MYFIAADVKLMNVVQMTDSTQKNTLAALVTEEEEGEGEEEEESNTLN